MTDPFGKNSPGGGGPTTWLSGAAGNGVADGSFGRWRGASVEVAATWADDREGQVNLWPLQPDAEYGDWDADLDLSIGAIYRSEGESWAAAAAGAYDDRWTKSLRLLSELRADRDGTVFLRFAHEFNGGWFDWRVDGSEADDFIRAWRRFRALQRVQCPAVRLTFCPNIASADGNDLDWRDAFPGADAVDVISVDVYNQYPFTNTPEEFAKAALAVDSRGAPAGLEQHRRFARTVGLPFAVSEWSGNADEGDSPVFVQQMRAWFEQNAGDGPGRLLYEVQFNVGDFSDGRFQIFPRSKQPLASAIYRQLW